MLISAMPGSAQHPYYMHPGSGGPLLSHQPQLSSWPPSCSSPAVTRATPVVVKAQLQPLQLISSPAGCLPLPQGLGKTAVITSGVGVTAHHRPSLAQFNSLTQWFPQGRTWGSGWINTDQGRKESEEPAELRCSSALHVT